MTRYKIMKNMENEQEKGKNYFKLWTIYFELWGLNFELLTLNFEVWTLNFMICALALYFTFTDYEFRECFSSFELLTLIFEI